MCLQKLIAFTFGLILASTVTAEIIVTADDGRQVVLKDDGNWEYVNTDRFASTSDGRRIRLKADGQWEYVGEQTVPTVTAAATDTIQANTVSVELAKVEIEEYVEAATGNRKNQRTRTQTVFYFTVTASTLGDAVEPKFEGRGTAPNGFSVTDNKGKSYQIIEFAPSDTNSIQPGESINYTLKLKASPKWGPKSIALRIEPEVFSTNQPIILTAPLSSVETVRKK